MVRKIKERQNMWKEPITFEQYLKEHPKRYHDWWSERVATMVNRLYTYWNPRLKPLLTQFTLYVYWNLHVCCMDEEEVAFLVWQYIRYKVRLQSRTREYVECKKFLMEIDVDDLDHWMSEYHELRLDNVEDRPQLVHELLKR